MKDKLSTRLRVTLTLEVITMDGGTIREQRYGSIVPAASEEDTEGLALILSNTVHSALPVFLKAK